ncbi:MAG: tetratricopeptide repeat protein [bacterium]|nr:tetratricopeptide repeat protein [bacterium]MDA1292374.1 tetratricopeptide repeat protein [bacterium]
MSKTLERLEEAEQLKLIGQNSAALLILEELLIEDPENISALEEVADNELSLEHFNRAQAAAARAIALDAESYTGHYILGFLRSVEKQWEEGIVHLKKANSIRPNNAEILRCLGWALFNSGQRAQGIVTLERALNLDSENPLTLCDLGVAYLQTRNIVKAKSLFDRALELEPESLKALECIKAVQKLEEVLKES